MKRNIYLDSTLIAASRGGVGNLATTARRIGLDGAALGARMRWLKVQPEAYRLKVARAAKRIEDGKAK